MKEILCGVAALVFMTTVAYAIPATVKYQGTLREKGAPVTGNRQMQFRITNLDGTVVYWSSGDLNVPISNGHFSKELSPVGVDWQAVTPYLEVSINGNRLTPREPITGNIYSAMSASIVDGAVSTKKLDEDARARLIPSGAVMMFARDCPSPGWRRFVELDGKFPRGSATYDKSGAGSDTHTHSISGGDHTHSVSDSGLKIGFGLRSLGQDNYLVMSPGSGVGSFSQQTAAGWYGFDNGMRTPAPTGSTPSNSEVLGPKIQGATGPATFTTQSAATSESNVPRYVGLVYCEKL